MAQGWRRGAPWGGLARAAPSARPRAAAWVGRPPTAARRGAEGVRGNGAWEGKGGGASASKGGIPSHEGRGGRGPGARPG
eukprot:7238709-Lingulodinium_polyedra.AAC.1